MKDLKTYIKSGIIEAYALGLASADEQKELEELSIAHQEIVDALEAFSLLIERRAFENAVSPPITVKPMVLATVDYMDRLKNGEAITFPPLLNEQSTFNDYADWLTRPDMVLSPDCKDIQVKIIGSTPQVTTAIVWIKESAPGEVHHDEFERFLIIEGSCTITIGETDHPLSAGNFLSIPLFVSHHVVVTSNIACKVILQRIAA